MTSLAGKTALITGSTDGVGRMVAIRLGEAGARVLVHGRDRNRGNRVVADIAQSSGAGEFLAADLASLAEVRHLGETVRQRTDRLDILINNAGLGTAGASRQTTADGHELRLAVNYLAGFLLTHLLLPLLRQSAPARIVNVASAGQQPIDFADVMLTRGYSGVRAYCQSKLAQIMFTIDLAEALAGTGVTVTRCIRRPTWTPHGPARGRDAREQRGGRRRGDPQSRGLAGVEGRSGRYFNGLHEARADDRPTTRGTSAAPGDQPGPLRTLWRRDGGSRRSGLTTAGAVGGCGLIRAVSVRSTRSAARSGMRCGRRA